MKPVSQDQKNHLKSIFEGPIWSKTFLLHPLLAP